MKILHDSRNDKPVAVQTPCSKCRSLLEVTLDDPHRTDDNPLETFHVFTCPVCKGEVHVNAKRFKR